MIKVTHILKCLLILTKTHEWLHAYNFNQYENIFIGHRGCARISDCQKKYPFIVDVRNDPIKPRLYEYRLNWENLEGAMEKLREQDKEAWSFLKDALALRGVKTKIKKLVAEEQPNGSVRMVEKFIYL